MAAAPARRRPGATSPIPRLEPHVEPVKTPATTPAPTPTPTPTLAPAPQAVEVAPAPVAPVATIPAPVVAQRPPAPERKAVTFPMSVELKKRIETAVLRTQGHPGGYASFTAFMDGAATRELARLEAEYNGGEAFEPNPGRFRAGRPIG